MRLLFVCRGNICRSPMAAGLAGKLLPAGVRAESAGIAPFGYEASAAAVQVLRLDYAVDISGHVPRDVADLPLPEFDYVVALDSSIHAFLRLAFPLPPGRLLRWEVEDPYLQEPEAYRRCAAALAGHLQELAAFLKEPGKIVDSAAGPK